MRLFDWILGRGRNPLEVPDEPQRARVDVIPHVRTPETHTLAGESVDDARFAEEADQLIQQQARTLGVSVDVLVDMLEQREMFVAKVEGEPRTWGFDLAPPDAVRRDAAAEYRRATRLTGTLGDSFLAGYEPLMAAAPNPLTMPDGTPLPQQLEYVDLEPDVARDIAAQLRATIQATLGQPLDEDAVERAVREAAWDHDLDVTRVLAQVLRALEDVL